MSRNSPLLKLPPGLRNIIYRCALITNVRIDVTRAKNAASSPGLPATSRQVQSEAVAIYYSENIFAITFCYSRKQEVAHSATSWLRAIGPVKSNVLKKLYVQLQAWECFLKRPPMAATINPEIEDILSSYTPLHVRTLFDVGVCSRAIEFTASVGVFEDAKTFMDQISFSYKRSGERAVQELVDRARAWLG